MTEQEDLIIVGNALHVLSRWIEDTGAWMRRYEAEPSLYRVSKIGTYRSCILTMYESGVRQLIQLVFEGDTVISDCAAYFVNDSDLFDEKTASFLEEESDWLYWESEIVRQEADPSEPYAGLLYTNAYTTRSYRRRGLFRNMMKLMEEYASENTDRSHLYSVISLDPDVACYGPDKTDEPYYYSMKDEPVRLLNAEIIKRVGFQPLKLETDEAVEDGSILWFAIRKATYLTYEGGNYVF